MWANVPCVECEECVYSHAMSSSACTDDWEEVHPVTINMMVLVFYTVLINMITHIV